VLSEIPQLGEYLWVSAFDTKPQSIEQLLRNAAEKYPDVSVQCVDLNRVPGSHYLLLATVNALKSYHSKQPIAKSLGMELLLYISGSKQINEALTRVGVTSETNRIAALTVGSSSDHVSGMANYLEQMLGQHGRDDLLDDWSKSRIENVRLGFEIGDKELKAMIRTKEPTTSAIERLAIERSAMVALRS
jgi:tRNA threonylcarbamoyladenosine modification (KEOPS) complex Cgi121 subunit